jgi:spermidine synthase
MAGRLFSVSTCGSIAGTFVTAFWLVPAVGVDQLLAVMAATLLGAAALVAVANRLWPALFVAIAASAGAVVASFALVPHAGATLSPLAAANWSPVFRDRGDPEGSTPPFYSGKVVYRKDTQYHRIAVVDSDQIRQLRFDSSYQSATMLKDPYATVYDYTDYMQLGLAYNPAARNVLMIGLGGGTVAKRVRRDFPQVSVEIVELDPVVSQVARRYFSVPQDGPGLHTTIEDGRQFLLRDKRKWDVIMIDAYYADAIPFHMVTLEFLELARSRLSQDGVIVTNAIGAVRGEGSELFRSMYRTYRAVFPSVAVHPVDDPRDYSPSGIGNIILVASEFRPPTKDDLARRWARRRQKVPKAVDLDWAIRSRWEEPISSEGVPILTDDYAPTDALLLR